MLARRIAFGASCGFLALAVAVRLGLLDGWDSAVREQARPGDVWGPDQIHADYIVEGLRPPVAASLLAVGVVVVCLVRRSLRPAVLAGGCGLLTAAITLTAKAVLGRSDPHATAAGHGGSFPSGHTASLMLCVGLAVFLLWPRGSRWGWLIPGFAAATMGTALVIEAAHWASDVVGGGLLASAVLATASATGFSGWSAGPRTSSENDPRSARGATVPGPAP
ncbi:MAG TPA: phosphatase PAP2 family protein [Kineosporiaceae bacterium]|nr:phosphatase PAP2 family protein [Kineosporiaceae bacterium]